jgi:Winged helix-turn-helix domain (DUF2582)
MVDEIGENSGKIWEYLREKGPATADEIKRSLKLNHGVLYMAIGWLAREGKLIFEGHGKTAKLSLK